MEYVAIFSFLDSDHDYDQCFFTDPQEIVIRSREFDEEPENLDSLVEELFDRLEKNTRELLHLDKNYIYIDPIEKPVGQIQLFELVLFD